LVLAKFVLPAKAKYKLQNIIFTVSVSLEIGKVRTRKIIKSLAI